jgi:dienelactone hydrolase
MFESYPGMWSTGNLYLPSPLPEKAPAILNVIGHWADQRLTRKPGEADYPQQFANFARMGFICLTTDMIGMVDSRQVSHNYGQGEKELWLSNGLGIQLWNNIRALDLLCSMPEVDAENIGMTGASGGGSQTLFLALLDDRVKAAAPINMISLHMQGGCACENAAGLRIHTDNVEMCAMIAPRALFLAGSDGDWTQNLQTAEFPAVLETYRLYGAEDKAEYFYQHAPHQYNEHTRRRVYRFFARHLMGKDCLWEEESIVTGDLQDLTWFRGEGRAPGFDGDEDYFTAHRAELAARISTLPDTEKKKMLAWVTGIRENRYQAIPMSEETLNGVTIARSVIFGESGEKLPFVQLTPAEPNGRICLALGGEGKDCLDHPDVQAMLAEGYTVVSGDLFLTGESAGETQTVSPADTGSPYYYGATHHTTFNYTPDTQRIRDASLLMSVAAHLGGELTVWASGCAARSVACALPLCGCVAAARLEAAALELSDDAAYMEKLHVPGIRAMGGIAGCLALAPCPVALF